MAELFKLEIPALGEVAAGSIVVTSPADKVYLLTFSSPPDNRLRAPLLQTFLLALDIIELRYPIGIVVTTSAIPKFYSNGLDLDHVNATPGFRDDYFYPVEKRLSTYPMPTIALMNGHTFAGGLIMAMHHDYRIMNPNKGFACMNEVDFGALMDSPFIHIFKEKLVPTAFRDLLLEAHRFPAQEALKAGLVDGLGGLPELLEFAKARNLVKKGESRVYGRTKEDMYRHVVSFTDSDRMNHRWRHTIDAERELYMTRASERVESWEKQHGKPKL